MKKGDAICSECGAGFRRLELTSMPPSRGEYRCPTCGTVLEKFDGTAFVAYRLTIHPVVRDMRQ
jgi:DNA-directed RNA polymerase subunit RPC12/RpoP